MKYVLCQAFLVTLLIVFSIVLFFEISKYYPKSGSGYVDPQTGRHLKDTN